MVADQPEVKPQALWGGRRVTTIEEKPREMRLADVPDDVCVVLLGDPGSGKTTCMREAAAALGGCFLTVRSALAGGRPHAPGTTLFLDALDEALADGKGNPVREVVQFLRDWGTPRFWLSCRPVDWKALVGEPLLAECVGPGRLLAVRLLPLEDSDLARIIRGRGHDTDRFLAQAETAGLRPLLGNPQTLAMMLDVVSADGGLPTSRRALFSRAVQLLAAEGSQTRPSLPGTAQPSRERVLEAAGLACAVIILTGRDAMALGPNYPLRPASDVTLDDVDPGGELHEALRAAVGSRLFSATASGDTWAPQHRTIAEFLTARYLAQLVTGQRFPLRRVLAFLLGPHGEPHPSLRGVFGWLAALLPARATEMVGRDPYGVLAYGDAGELPHDALAALLAGLGDLAERDPYFRAGLWDEARFAPLSAPSLAAGLREAIERRPWHGHLLSCILDGLSQGDPRPELVVSLCDALCDASLSDDRVQAVPALIRACDGDLRPAVSVFRRLIAEPDLDASCGVAAALLIRLYPQELDVSDLRDFAAGLARLKETSLGSLAGLEWRLPARVPSGQEAAVLDAWAAQEWASAPSATIAPTDSLRRIAALLLVRALPALDASDAERLLGWLRLVRRTYATAAEQAALKAAFAARPELFAPLLVAACSAAVDKEVRPLAPSHGWLTLRRLAPWWDWPVDAGERALDAALSTSDPTHREALFSASLILCEQHANLPLFERLHQAAGAHGDFGRLAANRWVQPIPPPEDNWRADQAAQRRAHAEGLAQTLTSSRTALRGDLAGIEAGTASGHLDWLAKVWRGHWPDLPGKELLPAQRLEEVTDHEIAAAAQAGWRRLAAKGPLPSAAKLAALRVHGKRYNAESTWLLGAGLLFGDAGERLPALPSARLVALLALALADRSADAERKRWMGRIATAFPHEASKAVSQLIQPQLVAGLLHADGLHDVLTMPEFAAIRRGLLPAWLRLPANAAVAALLQVALQDVPAAVLLQVIRERLTALAHEGAAARLPWLIAAWRLDAEAFAMPLAAALDGDSGRLSELVLSIGERGFRDDPPATPPLSLAHRIFLARQCAPSWPAAEPEAGFIRYPSAADLGRFVVGQLLAIASDPAPEAGAFLAEALADAAYASHHAMIKHAIVAQRRAAARRVWQTPAPAALAAALRAGAPATAQDLRAFVEEHLRGLNDELRTTSENRWKGFWNSGPETQTPKIENDCRDHLCALVGARLEGAGLAMQIEARSAGDDRCDIIMRSLDAKLPIEAKRDSHPELWTAWRDQLGERYARDPAADGYGIYLVFWFGERPLRHPSIRAELETPIALESALQALIDESGLPLTALVLDVSPPGRAARKRRAPRRAARKN